MDPSLELEVMGDVATGLKKLAGDADAARRVLQWAASAFLPRGTTNRGDLVQHLLAVSSRR